MIRSGASGLRAVLQLAADFLALVASALQSRSRLAAENLFLRRQLALYVERQLTPRRPERRLGSAWSFLAMDRLAGPARRGEA
jgi:hypothetical protein